MQCAVKSVGYAVCSEECAISSEPSSVVRKLCTMPGASILMCIFGTVLHYNINLKNKFIRLYSSPY